jgi:hypothetical protein
VSSNRSGFESHPLRHFLLNDVWCLSRGNGYGSDNRVNILKKTRVDRNQNLYLAAVGPNGKFRVHDKVEVHPEEFYGGDGTQAGVVRDRTWRESAVLPPYSISISFARAISWLSSVVT